MRPNLTHGVDNIRKGMWEDVRPMGFHLID